MIPLAVTGFLEKGEKYVLKDPEVFYGMVRQWGTCEGATIPIAVTEEFHVFVLIRE